MKLAQSLKAAPTENDFQDFINRSLKYVSINTDRQIYISKQVDNAKDL